MGSWSPIRDFEDEMMDMQPEYDMIYSKCEQRNNIQWHDGDTMYTNGKTCNNNNLPVYDDRKDLKNDAKIRELSLKTNKIGKQYDENDSDSEYTKETEILSMIRKCGLESDINEHLDSKKTLPTVQSNKKYQMNGNNSKFIVFLDESYFKLRPKNQLQSSEDEDKKNCDNKNDKSKEKNMKIDDNDNTDLQDTTFTVSTSNSSSLKSSTTRKQQKSKTDESSNLLQYYDKVKFYSPKEIYYKKKLLRERESETKSSSSEIQRQPLITASSSSSFNSFETSS